MFLFPKDTKLQETWTELLKRDGFFSTEYMYIQQVVRETF